MLAATVLAVFPALSVAVAMIVAFPLAGKRDLISAALYLLSVGSRVHETVVSVPSLERTTPAIPEPVSLTVRDTGNAAFLLE